VLDPRHGEGDDVEWASVHVHRRDTIAHIVRGEKLCLNGPRRVLGIVYVGEPFDLHAERQPGDESRQCSEDGLREAEKLEDQMNSYVLS